MSLRVLQCERLNTVAAGIIMFHLTFSFSTPSLCNSTSLLPCHSSSFLSLLLFESSPLYILSHFLVLIAPLLLCVCCDELQAARHACCPPEGWLLVLWSTPEDEQMWHSPIVLSLFSLVSPFAVTSPTPRLQSLFPISLSMYLSLTLFACLLWEWWVILREWGCWRNRDIASRQNQLYYLFFSCVCMWLCIYWSVDKQMDCSLSFHRCENMWEVRVCGWCLLHLSAPIWGKKNSCTVHTPVEWWCAVQWCVRIFVHICYQYDFRKQKTY